MKQLNAMLERVTAGEALDRVVHTLTERRPLDEVLTEILSQSRAMLDASETYALLRSGEHLVVRASDGLVIGVGGQREFPLDHGIEGLAASTGNAVISNDLFHDPRHVDPFHRPAPIGSMLAVPLILRGVLLGVLASTRREPSRFADAERWWLEIFGGLIASVIASDQAYRYQERRARQAETLLALSSIEDEPPVSEQTLAEVARAFGNNRCGILLSHEGALSLHLLRRDDQSAGGFLTSDLSIESAGALAQVIQTGQPLSYANIQKEETLRGVFFLAGGRSLIAAPIQVSGQTSGALYVVSDNPDWLDGEDVAFLALVAARIGLLIERGELRRRQREIERQHAQTEARQEFLGIVSHELKTPVAVMRAYTELLLRRAEKGGRSGEIDVLRRMGDQAERMLAMIEQLLDSRRLEAGLLALEIGHFDFADLVRKVAHDVELTARSHQILVDAPRRATIRADRRRIEEVITNLLDNAVKYSPPGGAVRVRVGREAEGTHDESLLLSVSDDGPGVGSQDRSHVFERFYQAPGRLHKGRAGLGLGLYISRELARRHGGDVWLESERGRGAIFYVRLPVAGPPNLE
ncbi:MAG TPA: GAF domain-containing sensor histidine kinase [Chloroflexota bacterium]|nr:GAF domain-containing sensor histidine kinase [Chloroflexota bacterium]